MKRVLAGISLLVLFAVAALASLDSVLDTRLLFETPKTNKIDRSTNYYLECETRYTTDIAIGGTADPETYILVGTGREKAVLTVEGQKGDFFGAEYIVLEDSELALIMMRYYPVSGLTEVVSIDKDTGLGFDTKTKVAGMLIPTTTTTYLLACE